MKKNNQKLTLKKNVVAQLGKAQQESIAGKGGPDITTVVLFYTVIPCAVEATGSGCQHTLQGCVNDPRTKLCHLTANC